MASTPQIWDGVDDVRLDIRHGRGAGGLLISWFTCPSWSSSKVPAARRCTLFPGSRIHFIQYLTK